MSAASNYLEDKLLDHALRYSTAPYTAPSTIYVALFADSGGVLAGGSSPLESNTSGTDATNKWGYYEIQTTGSTNYARQSVSFAAADTTTIGTIETSTPVSFPVAGADYQTAGSTGNVVTHIALMDASTGGNVLFYGALTTPKTVSSGDQFTVSTGNLSISLA